MAAGGAESWSVGALMDRHPKRVHNRDSLVEAARTMRDHGLDRVPVCDESEMLCGVLTDRQIVVRGVADGRDPSSTRVGDLAEGDPVAIDVGETLGCAFDLMAMHRMSRLPVLAGRRLVGELTRAAVLTAMPERVLAELATRR